MSSDHDQARPRPSGRCEARDLGDEFVLYDRTGERVHLLNGAARAIYLLCDGSRSPEEIASEMTARFDVDPVTARADVARMLLRLANEGLLVLDAA